MSKQASYTLATKKSMHLRIKHHGITLQNYT